MSEWQPIETAPKDGTRIDLWVVPDPSYPKFRTFEADRWTNTKWLKPRCFLRGGWSSLLHGGSLLLPKTMMATHWMPPPEPPQ